MNLKQAYKTLEISEESDKDIAKKAFKQLAKKYHPDLNKEDGAEAKFKEINEAWQVINSGKASTREEQEEEFQVRTSGFNINDFINNHFNINKNKKSKYTSFVSSDITIDQEISFKESVLGCTKEISYNHNMKCESCDGSGDKKINNGCTKCKGSGRFIIQQGFTIIEQTCPSCKGKFEIEDCGDCKTVGYNNITTKITVNIPPGVINDNKLILGNIGNYYGQMMGSDQYSRTYLKIKVKPQDNLSIKDNDVIYNINISLLEALKGCKKSVPTIDGEKEINIPAVSKNKNEIIINKMGLARKGDQVVILNIEYPTDVSEIISLLEKKVN